MNIHPAFRLNNQSFSTVEELLNYTKTFSKEVYTFFLDWFNKEDYVIVHTSGSTGKPKPILLKKAYMENSAKATGVFFNLKENTTALVCMSTNYIAGKMMLVRALVLGWHIDIVEPSSNPLENLEKTYDFTAMVPMQLQASLGQLHKVKKLIVGGGVVAFDLIKKIQQVSTHIYATYGMTETITHIAVKKLNHFETSEKEQAIYTTLPEVYIEQDSRNCLVINAPKVSEEKIITNDIVNLISEKEFEWLGRFDHVINSGGVKLHPELIEEKLEAILTTRFFVAGISDAILGEKLIVVIEGNESDKSRAEITGKIKVLSQLSAYEKPKEIFFVPKFIETETGKIQRQKTLKLIKEY